MAPISNKPDGSASKKTLSPALWAAIAAALLCLVIAAYFMLRSVEQDQTSSEAPEQTLDVEIIPSLQAEGVTIRYAFAAPKTSMVLPLEFAHAGRLSVREGDPETGFSAQNNLTRVTTKTPFTDLHLILSPISETPEKDTPLLQMGTVSAVLNFAKFIPVEVDGTKLDIPEQKVFHWLGRIAPERASMARAWLEPSLPLWIRFDLASQLDALVTIMNDRLGPGLQQPPDLMMLYQNQPEGMLRIEGDTVPGQAKMRLLGGGFDTETEQGADLILRTLSHELVHLWQLNNPASAASPDWLHEGFASALGDEMLFMADFWDEARYGAALNNVPSACAKGLKQGQISAGPAEGRHKISYDCGHFILLATSRQISGSTISDLWQAFTAWSENGADWSEDSFLTFVAQWSNDQAFADSLQRFIQGDFRQASSSEILSKVMAGTL